MHGVKCADGTAIPRGLPDHRTREGRTYRGYVRAKRERLDLPADAMPTLKAAGLIVVELDRLAADLEDARTRHRRRDQNRIRRQMVTLRTQLVRLEERLELIASRQPESESPVTAIKRALTAVPR